MKTPANIDEIVRNASAKEAFLADSGWFADPNPEQLQQVYAAFERDFELLLPLFVTQLGEPTFTEQSEPQLRDELFCEAIRVAGWKRGDGYLLLAVGQHDQMTPVFISFGYRAT